MSERGGIDWVRGVREAYGRNEGAIPFVILFMPRTGSNLLAALLDTHPDVLCHHELFLPDSVHRSLSVREGLVDLDLGTPEQRDRAPYEFLRKVYSNNCGAKAVGFKLALSDPHRDVLLSLILNRNVRKIIVRRQNWLQVYTSALISEQTKQLIKFANADGTDAAPPPTVVVDVERFKTYERKRRWAYFALRNMCRASAQPWIELEYREIKSPDTMHRVLTFLEVDPAVELRERTVKQNPSRLRDRIANYDEVVRALSGTGLASYLDDGG